MNKITAYASISWVKKQHYKHLQNPVHYLLLPEGVIFLTCSAFFYFLNVFIPKQYTFSLKKLSGKHLVCKEIDSQMKASRRR